MPDTIEKEIERGRKISLSKKGCKQQPQCGFQKGNKIRNTGRTRFKKGMIPFNFKDKPGLVAIHAWVSRWKGKPKKCEMCGSENAKKYEWANIDHKYNRTLDEYIRVCTSCHRKYDIKFNNYKNK